MPHHRGADSGVRRGLAALFLWLLVGVACGKAAPSASPLPPQALKLAVLDAVGGHLTYCDPDVYPVGHGTPLQNARARFPTIKADRAAFEAHLAICPGCVAYLDQMRHTIALTGRLTEDSLSPGVRDELLAAFRSWKRA